jgi:argininosuccinate lyase
MYQSALKGYATATDLADYLVVKKVPFRDAHEIVGNTVHYAIEQGKPLDELSLQELQQFGTMIEQDVFNVLTLEGSVNARDHIGGTAPRQVRMAVEAAQQHLDKQTR